MGYLLFILFVGFLVLGIWRATAITLSVHDGRKIDFNLGRGLPFFILSALIFIFWMSFTTIDAGYRGVVLRFGALTGRTLQPGPHVIIPVFESVRPISVQVQVEKLDSLAASHDLQVVHTEVTLAYYQDPCCVTNIWSELNDDALNRVVIPAVQEAIKAQTAQFDAEQLVA